MNLRSIRFRLTLWYSLSFIITVILVFGIFYTVTKDTLFRQTDLTLANHGNKVEEVLRRQTNGMQAMLEKQVFLQEFSSTPGMLVIIMNNAGTIITSSTTSPTDKTVLENLFNQAAKAGRQIYINQSLSSHLRFWAKPVTSNGELQGVILIGHPIDVIEKSLDSLLTTLVIVLVGLSLPAALGGYFLAGRGMEPITQVSSKIKKISSENLEERVSNPQTYDELEELAISFNDLLDRLHASFKRERQFIADVAHELKTPLSTLSSGVEIALSKDRSKEDYKKALAETEVDINRLSGTLKNILDLAWSDADAGSLSGEVFSLSDEVEELSEMASKMAEAKNIKVASKIADNIKVFGKRDKLSRAILNLIDNAIKYTPEKGRVALSLKKVGGQAILEVRDTGVGIESSELPQIFDRFYRGEKNGKITGSGLGLAISQAVVTSHKGKIKAESQVGHGSTFTITLPLAQH